MKEIVFRPISTETEKIVEKPVPAKECFPDWYKKVPRYEENKLKVVDGLRINTTMKACMPFLDTFLTGYIQNTWTDIYIDATDPEDTKYSFALKPDIVVARPTINYYPQIEGFVKNELSWRQQWIPQLPRGYSMIYTHPFNRYDLPFLSLTGIIDNDQYYMENIANHPFFVRDGFQGVIPAGTPMFQMIPIKRDTWKSFFKEYDESLQLKFFTVRKFLMDGYKKMYWQKKEYN